MNEILSLIEALGQYDKKVAKHYKNQIKKDGTDLNKIKIEIEHFIKNKRWNISQGKKHDQEFMRHFEKHFVDREVI